MKKGTYLFLVIVEIIIWVLMILCSLEIIKDRPIPITLYIAHAIFLYSYTYQYIQKVKEDKEDKKPK